MTRRAPGSQAGPRQPAAAWTGRSRGGYLGNRIFLALIRHCHPRWSYALLIPVAAYFLFFARQAVSASQDYCRRMGLLPHSWLAKWRFTYRHFYSFGQTLLDRVAIISGNASAYSFEFDGEEHLAQALKEGKGMVIVSAHFGNWQAAAHLLGSLNAPLRLVAYEAEVAPIRELMAGVFSEGRFSVIPLEDAESASLAIMSALRNKEIVALHGDRVMDQASAETVPFLGAPARFPMGPFVVAALSGAPLVHTFAVRTKNWHYRLKAFPPEHLAFGRRADRAGLLQNWIKQFVERLEAVTRQYPLQWYNFYNFWETAVSQSGPGGRRR